MRAEYDSHADALSIDLVSVTSYRGALTIDDDYCTVALADGERAANVELLSPRNHLYLLTLAAERLSLDRLALQAAAKAALAAPDRPIDLTVRPSSTAA